MKKSNLLILLVLAILVLILAIVYFKDSKPKERVFRDFAVSDTASITKVILADKQNRKVILERKDNFWTANEIYRARRDFTNLLLEGLYRMEVASPVPQAKLDYVLRSLSANHIMCEIYQNGKLTKTYYVGGATENSTGTYMIMENSELPFILHIPGFSGYLTVRYTPDINEWRERIVFNYDVNEIHKIYIEYPNDKNESFIAVNNGNNSFEIRTINNKHIDFEIDTLRLKTFISKCKFVGFEAYIKDELQNYFLDSLRKEPMVSKLTIENFNSEKRSLKTYYRPNIDLMTDDEGILYDFDLDRLYGILEPENEAVLIQYYIIDPISYKLSDFKK